MAKIDEIVNNIVTEWEGDAHIDATQIDSASLSTPVLHCKYLRMLSGWKTKKTTLKSRLHEMRDAKIRYWRGEMSREELQHYGWAQWQYNKPAKVELENMLAADSDVSNIQMQLEGCETIIYVLESIMREINNRNFTISNYIKIKQFTQGETI